MEKNIGNNPLNPLNEFPQSQDEELKQIIILQSLLNIVDETEWVLKINEINAIIDNYQICIISHENDFYTMQVNIDNNALVIYFRKPNHELITKLYNAVYNKCIREQNNERVRLANEVYDGLLKKLDNK